MPKNVAGLSRARQGGIRGNPGGGHNQAPSNWQSQWDTHLANKTRVGGVRTRIRKNPQTIHKQEERDTQRNTASNQLRDELQGTLIKFRGCPKNANREAANRNCFEATFTLIALSHNNSSKVTLYSLTDNGKLILMRFTRVEITSDGALSSNTSYT